MSESHSHDLPKNKLKLAIFITGSIFLAEIIGGIYTNSLALLADAGHMLTDLAALILSFVAFKIGERKANTKKTFGYKRFEIVIAFVNGLILWALSIYISYEAVLRLFQPEEIKGGVMLVIAIFGLIANLVSAYLLFSHSHDNLNIRGAFLHVVGDALGSIGAILAGIFIITFGWYIVDPVVSILISVLIIISSWNLVRDSLNILLEGAPKNIDQHQIGERLKNIKKVRNIHDIHIWTITSGVHNLSCHMTIENFENASEILSQSKKILETEFNISHMTIQLEPVGFDDCFDCGSETLETKHEHGKHDHHH